MEGQRQNIVTIYGSTAGMGDSREGLADSAMKGSTRSLPVVREQYCVCAPTTPLEKRLVIAVVTLVVVIILLLVIIIILATRDEESQTLRKVVAALTPKF